MPCPETDQSRGIDEQSRLRSAASTVLPPKPQAALPGAEQGKEDAIAAPSASARNRAREALGLVAKLKANSAKYEQEQKLENGKWVSTRNWQDYTRSDCSKFVQWTLEAAGQGALFGRDRATTECMINEIERLEGVFRVRRIRPALGDLVLWGRHVALVSEVDPKQMRLRVSQMGQSSGADNHWIKQPPSPEFDERVKRLGSGGFLGFWTPPEA